MAKEVFGAKDYVKASVMNALGNTSSLFRTSKRKGDYL